MSATEELLKRDPYKSVIPIEGGKNHRFQNADMMCIGDPSGIAIEEGELLYGILRCLKPQEILETGTNVGTSAMYMALAVMDNGFGNITTLEHDSFVADVARKKLVDMGLARYVNVITGKVEDFKPLPKYDFMWLDTELAIRYGELIRFYPNLADGGIVGIHDISTLDMKEFGSAPELLRSYLRNGLLRVVHFYTDHGVTFFQKSKPQEAVARMQRGEI